MLHAIAIDDEPVALEVIKTLAAKIPFVHIAATFTNAFEAARYLQEQKTDLIFLDIKMPDISGIDFLQSIPNPPMTIFTTAYSEHAVQSFELDAIDYLLKPFSQARFLKACNKAWEQYSLRSQGGHLGGHVFVKSGNEQLRIEIDTICYIESFGNYVQFVTSTQKIMSRLTMSEVEEILPSASFVRVHRSYIVSAKRIAKIEKDAVWIGETEIPVGKNYQQELEKITRPS
jgi:two-component system LytT family response regulator